MLSINFIDKSEYAFNASLFKSIQNINKKFIINTDHVFIINNKHISVGVIIIEKKGIDYHINLFKTPNVCRLSILSLIEASVLLSQKLPLLDKDSKVFFYSGLSSYNFKYKLILDCNGFEEDDDKVSILLSTLTTLDKNKITKRDVEFI